jgi:hypothetical protein
MEALHFLVLAGVELESPSGRPDSGDRNATTGDFSGFSHSDFHRHFMGIKKYIYKININHHTMQSNPIRSPLYLIYNGDSIGFDCIVW